jgi:LPS sulfotransferase NodH
MATVDLPTSDARPDLSEATLDSADFDRPAPTEPPVRYVILSARRSGSYMLCRMLIRAGLGVPHEYFLQDHIGALAARWRVNAGPKGSVASGAYLDALVERRSSGGLFGVKLQYWQYERALRTPQGERFLDGARLIYLYREDILKQAVSFRHAEITGRWGSDGAETTRPLRREDPFDPRGIERKINLLLYDELGWRAFVARRGKHALHLSYEDLCTDLQGSLCAVAAHLGVDAGRLTDLHPDPPSPHIAADAELKAQMLSTYLQRRKAAPRQGAWADGLADAVWSAWGRMNGLQG